MPNTTGKEEFLIYDYIKGRPVFIKNGELVCEGGAGELEKVWNITRVRTSEVLLTSVVI